MWGEEDKLIPYEAAGWYMDHLPDATLAAYPGIGHLPMEEAPERSAADLQQWLARTLSSRDTPQGPGRFFQGLSSYTLAPKSSNNAACGSLENLKVQKKQKMMLR